MLLLMVGWYSVACMQAKSIYVYPCMMESKEALLYSSAGYVM